MPCGIRFKPYWRCCYGLVDTKHIPNSMGASGNKRTAAIHTHTHIPIYSIDVCECVYFEKFRTLWRHHNVAMHERWYHWQYDQKHCLQPFSYAETVAFNWKWKRSPSYSIFHRGSFIFVHSLVASHGFGFSSICSHTHLLFLHKDNIEKRNFIHDFGSLFLRRLPSSTRRVVQYFRVEFMYIHWIEIGNKYEIDLKLRLTDRELKCQNNFLTWNSKRADAQCDWDGNKYEKRERERQ